jgi:hypothetical protein
MGKKTRRGHCGPNSRDMSNFEAALRNPDTAKGSDLTPWGKGRGSHYGKRGTARAIADRVLREEGSFPVSSRAFLPLPNDTNEGQIGRKTPEATHAVSALEGVIIAPDSQQLACANLAVDQVVRVESIGNE